MTSQNSKPQDQSRLCAAQEAILHLPGIHRLRSCIRGVPSYVRSRRAWIVRRFFLRWISVPVTIEHTDGAKYRLRGDRIADQILDDLHQTYAPLFFPEDLDDVPEGETILDLGAHHGAYAITALFRFPKSRIISVEPDPVAAAACREHFALNQLQRRAEVYECGVGPEERDALLEQSDEGSWGNRVVTEPTAASAVPIRLKPLAAILQGRRPYLVKCNCEGGEFYAIPQLFAMGVRPRFIILLLHPQEGSVPGLLQMVREAGYTIHPVHNSESHPRYVCRLVAGSDNTDTGESAEETQSHIRERER